MHPMFLNINGKEVFGFGCKMLSDEEAYVLEQQYIKEVEEHLINCKGGCNECKVKM